MIASRRVVIALSAMLFAGSTAALAQTPVPNSTPQPVVEEPNEPDFSVINLPTTRALPKWKGGFHLTHRFLGNLRQGTFKENLGNVFGIDIGAVVGIEYRIGVHDRVQAVFYRNSADKTIQFSTKIDVIRQGGRIPASLSAIASVEGNQNFGLLGAGEDHDHTVGAHQHKSPALGAVVSRTFGDRAAVYAVPVFVRNSLKLDDTSHRNTFVLGTGARLRIRSTVYLVGEVAPRLAGYAPGKPACGFGIEKRAGWHMFQLTFANSTATTFGQIARGGFPGTIYFGFNLGRKFL